MRSLDANTLAAQKARTPQYRVQARLKRRGTFASDPLIWQEGYDFAEGTNWHNAPYRDNNTVDGRTTACSLAQGGAILQVVRSAAAGKIGARRLTSPQTASTWPTTATAMTDIANVSDGFACVPGVARNGEEIVVVWGDGAELYRAISDDDGATWGAAASIFDGTGTFTRYTNICMAYDATNERYYCVYNAIETDGDVRLRGMDSEDGTTWTQWGTHSSTVEWLVSGIVLSSSTALHVYLFGLNEVGNSARSSLARGTVTLAAGAFDSYWTDPAIIDRGGQQGELLYENVRYGQGGGAAMVTLTESLGGKYSCVATFVGGLGSILMEEPRLLTQDTPDDSSEWQGVAHLTPVAQGEYVHLVGTAKHFFARTSQTDPWGNTGAIRTYTPTKYRYEAQQFGGGRLDIEFPAEDKGDGFYVRPNDILWLDRAVTNAGSGGIETIPFRVYRIDRQRTKQLVTAYDALGVLAQMRARRTRIFRTNDRLLNDEIQAIIAWAGVTPAAISVGSGSEKTSGFVWGGAESALSALHRRTEQHDTAFFKSVFASSQGTEHTQIDDFTPATTSQYTYSTDEQDDAHRLAEWSFIDDGLRPGVVTVVGVSDSFPDDADYWQVRLIGHPGNMRPHPFYYVNRNLIQGDGEVEAYADSEEARLVLTVPVATIETYANIGLELYDLVTVDDTDYRVYAIQEDWDGHILKHRITLTRNDIDTLPDSA